LEHGPDAGGEFSYVAPRGGAVSLALAWLWPLDSTLMREVYGRFVDRFWQYIGPLAGFREWAKGQDGKVDIDSGPVIAGYGAAATGFGLATTQAAGDWWRSAVLSVEFLIAAAAVRACALWQNCFDASKAFAVGDIRFRPAYLTGFLFGDACLFMVVTIKHLAHAANPRRPEG
jgi:hypothetical protein